MGNSVWGRGMKVLLINIISFQLGKKVPQMFRLLTDTNPLVIMHLMKVSTNGLRNYESNYEGLLKCFLHLSSIIWIQPNFPSKLKSGAQANLCDGTFKNRCPIYLYVNHWDRVRYVSTALLLKHIFLNLLK